VYEPAVALGNYFLWRSVVFTFREMFCDSVSSQGSEFSLRKPVSASKYIIIIIIIIIIITIIIIIIVTFLLLSDVHISRHNVFSISQNWQSSRVLFEYIYRVLKMLECMEEGVFFR